MKLFCNREDKLYKFCKPGSIFSWFVTIVILMWILPPFITRGYPPFGEDFFYKDMAPVQLLLNWWITVIVIWLQAFLIAAAINLNVYIILNLMRLGAHKIVQIDKGFSLQGVVKTETEETDS